MKFYRLIFYVIFTAGTVAAQTGEFTYQGKLTGPGSPANAAYDMQFRLFDNANAGQGTQHGVTVTRLGVLVWNGRFSVALNFGRMPFTGGVERYLEINIRKAGNTGGYMPMAPRQKLTSAPYPKGEQHREKENADLQRQVDDLRSSLAAQKAEIERLRILLFCRTTMRPELCGEER